MRLDQQLGGTPEERVQMKDRFVKSLREELDGLLGLLKAQEDKLAGKKRIDPRSAEGQAVEVIQFARYGPAADLCVRLLDTRRTDFPVVSDENQAFFPFFPFAVAAAAIGTLALAGLTKELATADEGTTRFQLGCLVLKEMLGEELAAAYLALAAKKDSRLKEGNRQEQAAQLFKAKTTDWEATLCSDYTIE